MSAIIDMRGRNGSKEISYISCAPACDSVINLVTSIRQVKLCCYLGNRSHIVLTSCINKKKTL